MNWDCNIRPVCTHASAVLFPAEGNEMTAAWCISCKYHRNRAICTSEKKCWWKSSMPKRGNQLERKNKKNKAQFNQIKTRLNRTAPGSGLGALLSYLVQSSPSSGVISVSLCTTTLVTDMSGCCSLASFMAWARAYIRECSAKRDHQGETENGERQGGSGGCWIVSQYANREVIFSHISYTSRIC